MTHTRAFSLGETLLIVVLMGAFAAFVAPQFAGATEDRRTSDAEVVIGGVRDAIEIYADRSRERGAATFPTVTELGTPGIVTMRRLPANPFTGARGVQAVTRAQAENRAVLNQSDAGWNYYFDNTATPPLMIFYANCHTTTTVPTRDGSRLMTANEL